jgi:hypothetical protein
MPDEILTTADVAMIDGAAYENDMHVRDFPRWPDEGNTIAVVGDERDLQPFIRTLAEYDEDSTLYDKLGDWTCEGVGLSTVWYWRRPTLSDEAAELLDKIQEQRGNN